MKLKTSKSYRAIGMIVALVASLLTAIANPMASSAVSTGASWNKYTATGEAHWSSIASSSDGKKLAAVQYVDYNDGLGSIWTSTNSGNSWVKRTSAGLANWTSIASSADGTKLAAVSDGSGGSIWTSADSGTTWTERTSAGNAYWSSITSSNDGVYLAATSFRASNYSTAGSIWTSVDSGVNWTEQTGVEHSYWSSITSSADGSKLAAVSAETTHVRYGDIWTSADYGVTWELQSWPFPSHWKSISSSDDGSKLALVAFQTLWDGPTSVWLSADYGVSWTEQTSLGQAYWNSISSSADGTHLSVAGFFTDEGGVDGKIWSSADSGTTWVEQTSAGSANWQAITSSDDGAVAAVSWLTNTRANYGSIWTLATVAAPTISSVSPTSGPLIGGITITITGAGFVSGATVTIDGTACGSVTFVSVTSLTCVTPYLSPPTGSVGAKDVVVTNPDAQTAISTGAYTYVAIPTFTSVSPNSGPVAGGTSITVTGTGFVAGDTVTFNGATGSLGSCTSVNVTSATTLTCVTPAGAVGTADINIDDVYRQNALGTDAFTFNGIVFSASTPSIPNTYVGSFSPVQTETITNTGNLNLVFGPSAVAKSGTNSSDFTIVADNCSSHTLVPNSYCTVTYKFKSKVTGTRTANLVFTSNSLSSPDNVALSAVSMRLITMTKIVGTAGTTRGGTRLEAVGTGFDPAATVTIGGINATVTGRTGSTKITVTTPAHPAGRVLVVVTNPDGGSASYGWFTYR